MTDAALELLATFEKLPRDEQHAVVAELLRRTGEPAESPLADNDLLSVADQLFQTLDAEEDNDPVANAR